MIKVLVVDDSSLMRRRITDILNSASNIKVVGTARDGVEAIAKIDELKPDVVTMDIEMPRMDGLATLSYLMTKDPLPIVMLSAMDKIEADLAVKSLELGAVDFVSKPSKQISLDIEEVEKDLIFKVKTASYVDVKKMSIRVGMEYSKEETFIQPKTDKKIVVIGASSGGPHALSKIIPKLPRNFPLAVLIVQHMPVGFTKSLSKRLRSQASISLKEAENGDLIRPGHVFIAPSGYHMEVKWGKIELNKKPKVNGFRPSIDVTMKSVAKYYGDKVIGVILSGMGKDGAIGMKFIKEKGGTTVAQNKLSSLIFGMANVAIEMGVVDVVVPLSGIVEQIGKML